MIQIDALSIGYQGETLIDQATFSIQEGEHCGFVGRNGTGKSTLLRLIVGDETPDGGKIAIRKNYSIGFLNQHIRFTKPTLLEEAALGLPKGQEDCLYKAEKILFGLGFKEEEMDLSPSLFSGGYQLRLHLAKVLISEPNCLLLDEPTNYLDIVSIRWFARFLKQWPGEFILISHDREFMDSVTTHTMGIHRHKVRKVKGDTVAFYEQILQQEEIHERTRVNLDKKRAHVQTFIDRFGAKAAKAAQAQSKQKLLSRIPILEKLKDLSNLDFAFREAPFSAKMMIDVQQISFAYTPEHPLIDQLALSIEKGERIAIVGKNGRGKSTLLRILAQELAPKAGTIKSSENVAVGYFGQTNIDRLHPKHTIEEEISSANRTLNKTEVKGICGLMMFSGAKADKVTSVLSGGERSRVLLGKILATPCNLLLLDEPTHHLDMESIEALIDALEDFSGAVVIVTHSELILKRLLLDKIVVCHQGSQEVVLGSYEDFLDKNGWGDEEPAKSKKKGSGERDSKQSRADLINARARELKPYDQQIAEKEAAITRLEVEQEKAQAKLLELSSQGGSQAFQELSKEMAVRQKAIDQHFDQLEKLSMRREQIRENYAQKIEE
jgi:ATP-binding cassette, subfamily F, member 3